MDKKLKQIIEKKFGFSLNRNQYQSLSRLVFEIKRRENISLAEIIHYLQLDSQTDKYTGKNKFSALRNSLLKKRFPLTSACEDINKNKIFLNKLQTPLQNNRQVKKIFKPSLLLAEEEVSGSYLINNFKNQFPDLKIKKITSLKNYIKNNPFKIKDLKKPIVFIVREKQDFLKPCPCTKKHLSCGYRILNLGFGCPFDCSYCYLQQYTNTPGIILPANLDDFFHKFNKFEKNLKKPIRIGTGEFSDSVALDHLTNYSSQLISYFRDKNILFELKTKSNNIDNILREKPASNIIISWSLNPKRMVNLEELGSANLAERINAAKKIKDAGFKIAFHFDPIIYYKNWEQDYKELISSLYNTISAGFAWISLGTLRFNRQLKPISEKRFPKSNIFYEELLLGEDKKLRYPKFLRNNIYGKMKNWIREFDQKTPLYLCMEDKTIWNNFNKINSSAKIEKYLISDNL